MKINTADINKEVRNMSSPGNTRRDFLKATAVGAATLAMLGCVTFVKERNGWLVAKNG